MAEITIDEIKEKKDQMEKDLLDIIQQFENTTRLNISSVNIVAVHGGTSAYGYTADIKVKIII